MERALQKVLLPAIFITSKKKKLKLPCSWCCHHCERAPPHMRCACGMRWLLFIQHCHRLSTLIGVLLSLSPPAPSTDQPTDMADGKRWWTGRRNRRLAISASPNKEKDKKKNRNDDGFWHVNRAAQIKWIGRRTPKTESESILEEKKNQLNAFELCCCLGFFCCCCLSGQVPTSMWRRWWWWTNSERFYFFDLTWWNWKEVSSFCTIYIFRVVEIGGDEIELSFEGLSDCRCSCFDEHWNSIGIRVDRCFYCSTQASGGLWFGGALRQDYFRGPSLFLRGYGLPKLDSFFHTPEALLRGLLEPGDLRHCLIGLYWLRRHVEGGYFAYDRRP